MKNTKNELIDQYQFAEKLGLPVEELLNWYPNTKKTEVLGKVVRTTTDWQSVKHPFLFDNCVMVSAHNNIFKAIAENPDRKDFYLKITTESGKKWASYQKVIICMEEKPTFTTGGKRP